MSSRKDEITRELDRALGRPEGWPILRVIPSFQYGMAIIVPPGKTEAIRWNMPFTMLVQGFALISPYASSLRRLAVGNQLLRGHDTVMPSKMFRETVCRQCGHEYDWKQMLSFGIRWASSAEEKAYAGIPCQCEVTNNSPEEQSIAVFFQGPAIL